jgi:large subunit ribosomal protein L35Ae
MEAIIENFRRGRRTMTPNQMILRVEGVNKDKARSLIGKKVVWKSPAGKEIKGMVQATHGTKGAVRALFETGMPGQAIAQKVTIE